MVAKNINSFFPESLVQKTYWINHDVHGRERRLLFEQGAENIGLQAERISALYGSDLPDAEQQTLIFRVRARSPAGWHILRHNGN